MRVEDAVTFRGIQGRQPCKGGYLRRKGPLLPLREDAFAGAAKVLCGCIWTLPNCNGLFGSGSKVAIADVYPAS
jgi:hypothetical protein